MNRILCLSLFLGSLAHAIEFHCFTNLVGLAARDPEAVRMVDETFEALLDLPAEEGLKRRLAEAIVEGKDPFTVPDDEAELRTTGKKLAEFHEMVQKLGWDGPVTRARLIELARRRLDARAAAEKRVESALRNTANAVTFPLHRANRSIQSPDGRYVVASPYDRSAFFTVLDAVTGQSQHYDVAVTHIARPAQFTSDGKRLFYPYQHQLRFHDFVQGAVGVEQEPLGELGFWRRNFNVSLTIAEAHAAKNPDQVLVSYKEHGGIYLFDLNGRKVRKIPGTSGYKAEKWTLRPSTNEILTVVEETEGRKLKAVELLANGKLGPARVVTTFPKEGPIQHSGSLITANGSKAVLRGVPGGGMAAVVDLNGSGPYTPVPEIPTELANNMNDAIFHLHPNGKELLVSSRYKPPDKDIAVYAFDLEQGQYLGSFLVPRALSFGLSPDGESIVAKKAKEISFVPWRGRVGP